VLSALGWHNSCNDAHGAFKTIGIDVIPIRARKLLLSAFLFLGIAAATISVADAYPATLPHRALWPDSINAPGEFDRASRAEILVFARELADSDAFNEGVLKERLGIKAVDIASVERLRQRLWKRLTENYVMASHSCAAGEAFCAPDIDPNDLRDAAEAFSRAAIPSRYRPWFDDAVRFQRSYLDELLRLAAVFPERNSEVETFNDNELTGWDLHDRQFLLSFDDGPTPGLLREAPAAGNTDRTLEMLRSHRINGIFFAIGESFQARLRDSSVDEMKTLYGGMCVGSHGWVHDSHATSPHWQESVASSSKLVHDTLPAAYAPAFRPPYGQRRPDSGPYLKSQGLKLVLWNIDSHDWDNDLTADDVEARVMSLMLLWRRGLILFHDFFPRSQKVVPRLVTWLANDGITWADCHAIIDARGGDRRPITHVSAGE
jgi:peptidoglycan/xylan/chitin deacetylase (PgdA/CDA1 family)